MKMTKMNRLLAMLLALVMAFALTACGGKDAGTASGGTEDTGSAASTGSDRLTVEEYQDAFLKIEEEVENLNTQASSLDPTDAEGAKKLLEDMKKPFQDFTAVNPPEEYEEAHEKMASGCNAMVEYVDILIQMMDETDPAKLGDLTNQMVEKLEVATTDIMEGAAMLDQASA